MDTIPTCPWRWGERYLVTEFIQSQNQAVKEIVDSLPSGNQNEYVLAVANHVRDTYYYPLDDTDNPSTSGQMLRYRKGFMKYHFKNCRDYIWALPCEVINTKCGYCAETANLAASLLLAGKVPNSWVVLGEVRTSKDDRLLGYHAWTECPYRDSQHVMETTVDEPSVNILIPAFSAYDRFSGWSIKTNIYYRPQAKYNIKEYIGEGPLAGDMVQLMGMPAKRVLLFGIDRTLIEQQVKPARLRKEYLLEARLMRKLLLEAYRSS